MGSIAPQILYDQSYNFCEIVPTDDGIRYSPRWFIVICQLEIPEQQPLRRYIPAFVAENRFLQVGTKRLFEQVMQSLLKRHSSSVSPQSVSEQLARGRV
jgi:hypothetical protein